MIRCYFEPNVLHCGQRIAGAARWLDTHWRAAKVICLDFWGYQTDDDCVILPAPSASPGCARVLRVTCHDASSGSAMTGYVAEEGMAVGLSRWFAEVAPLCPNLVALHLCNVAVTQLPALPLLKHLILRACMFRPALVASLCGLASLETLHMSGSDASEPSGWDLRACIRLRRVYVCPGLAGGQAVAGKELCLPPACTLSLCISQMDSWQGWLARLGSQLVDLRLCCSADNLAPRSLFLIHAPQPSQLRHVTLIVDPKKPRTLGLARLLRGLPQCVQSLHLDGPYMLGEEEVIIVPASLRALRIQGVCVRSACSRACCCPPAERTEELCFGLHAGLERLQLVLWGARVGLRCLDAGAPAGLQELIVQARVVDMDVHLAAEVAQRGRVLERCDVLGSEWGEVLCSSVSQVQVVHIGQGPVQKEKKYSYGHARGWACTCGTCAECLGPEAFGGVGADVGH